VWISSKLGEKIYYHPRRLAIYMNTLNFPAPLRTALDNIKLYRGLAKVGYLIYKHENPPIMFNGRIKRALVKLDNDDSSRRCFARRSDASF
jgi:hypothetical protein